MPDLLDQRAERIGITFLRNRKINPFPAGLEAYPRLEAALFEITRPTERPRKKRIRDLVAEQRENPPLPVQPIDLPKGMVPYKRELYGPRERN